MKNLTKRMVTIAGIGMFAVVLAAGNLLVSSSVKTADADLLRNWGKVVAMARNEESWEGKKLKGVTCTCPNNTKGFSLKCRDDGDLENCTSTQQGSNACYAEKVLFGITTGLKMLCQGAGITFD